MMKHGSGADATLSGSGASGGSWVRCSSRAKELTSTRRCCVTGSRIVPCDTGNLAPRASEAALSPDFAPQSLSFAGIHSEQFSRGAARGGAAENENAANNEVIPPSLSSWIE